MFLYPDLENLTFSIFFAENTPKIDPMCQFHQLVLSHIHSATHEVDLCQVWRFYCLPWVFYCHITKNLHFIPFFAHITQKLLLLRGPIIKFTDGRHDQQYSKYIWVRFKVSNHKSSVPIDISPKIHIFYLFLRKIPQK